MDTLENFLLIFLLTCFTPLIKSTMFTAIIHPVLTICHAENFPHVTSLNLLTIL